MTTNQQQQPTHNVDTRDPTGSKNLNLRDQVEYYIALICIKHIFPSYAFDYIFFIYVRSSYIADLNSSLINQFELCFHFFYVSVVHRLTTDNSTTEKSNMSDSAPIIVAE